VLVVDVMVFVLGVVKGARRHRGELFRVPRVTTSPGGFLGRVLPLGFLGGRPSFETTKSEVDPEHEQEKDQADDDPPLGAFRKRVEHRWGPSSFVSRR